MESLAGDNTAARQDSDPGRPTHGRPRCPPDLPLEGSRKISVPLARAPGLPRLLHTSPRAAESPALGRGVRLQAPCRCASRQPAHLEPCASGRCARAAWSWKQPQDPAPGPASSKLPATLISSLHQAPWGSDLLLHGEDRGPSGSSKSRPPGICKWDLIRKKRLGRCTSVTDLCTRASWMRVGAKSNDRRLWKRKERET